MRIGCHYPRMRISHLLLADEMPNDILNCLPLNDLFDGSESFNANQALTISFLV